MPNSSGPAPPNCNKLGDMFWFPAGMLTLNQHKSEHLASKPKIPAQPGMAQKEFPWFDYRKHLRSFFPVHLLLREQITLKGTFDFCGSPKTAARIPLAFRSATIHIRLTS